MCMFGLETIGLMGILGSIGSGLFEGAATVGGWAATAGSMAAGAASTTGGWVASGASAIGGLFGSGTAATAAPATTAAASAAPAAAAPASTFLGMTPGTWGLVLTGAGLVGGAAGTGFSMYSAYQQGQQMQEAYDYQSDVNKRNADMAEQQAVSMKEQGGWQQQSMAHNYLKQNSDARAAYAANGVILGSGSELDWESAAAQQYQIDKREQDYNTRMKIWSARSQAVGFNSQADWNTYAGTQAQRAGSWGMAGAGLAGGGSLLSGGAAFSDRWNKLNV